MNKFLKIGLILLAIAALGFFGLKTFTKKGSPEDSVSFTKGDLTVKVDYCQPSVKGRTIFGELVPFGEIWRTGANEATTISFSRDVTINGETLAKGKYSLWTMPNPTEWHVIFNSDIPGWGTNYDKATDILHAKASVTEMPESTEMFKISFADADSLGINMNLKWDKTLVQLPIQ